MTLLLGTSGGLATARSLWYPTLLDKYIPSFLLGSSILYRIALGSDRLLVENANGL